MQQRQPRLGDVLDDYCPRERRVTNHVVVAMIGDNVKQTRCTTCDADHEYKEAKIPRVRRKTEPPAALAAQGFTVPKLHEHAAAKPADAESVQSPEHHDAAGAPVAPLAAAAPVTDDIDEQDEQPEGADQDLAVPDEGPVHRRLIRASLPRTEGTPPTTRPNPEFTIRQPNNNRQNRFRPRHGGGGGRGPAQFGGNGNRSFGGGFPQRQHGNNNSGRRRGRSK